jgi:D-glycero-alpha-D-manno-heptose 1-phosphate guanylyltransferase
MIGIVLVSHSTSLVSELYPVAGEPFLFWVTQWLKTQGCHHIVFSVHHHAEKVSAFVQQMSNLDPKLCLDVVIEPRPLGTAGSAAFCAKRFPSQLSFIVNGDSLLLTNVRYPISKLKKQPKPDAIIFGSKQHNDGRFDGLEINDKLCLTAFKEKQPSQGLVNAGVYLLRHELLDDISLDKESSLEKDYFPRWIAQNKHIEVISDDRPFVKIDSPKSLIQAEEFIDKHQEMFAVSEAFCHI